MHRGSHAGWRLVALLLAVAVAAAGCTSSTSSPGRGTTASTPGAGLPSGVAGATNVPRSVPNNPARRADVALTRCVAAPGGWAAGGTVHNPAGTPATYRITVFFTTTTATVIGVAATSVLVPGRQSKPWQAIGRFHAPPKVLCVLRGVG